MLGLATHEPNFTIIREEFTQAHKRKECADKSEKQNDDSVVPNEKRHLFVHLSILREYLNKELFVKDLPFKFLDFNLVQLQMRPLFRQDPT